MKFKSKRDFEQEFLDQNANKLQMRNGSRKIKDRKRRTQRTQENSTI